MNKTFSKTHTERYFSQNDSLLTALRLNKCYRNPLLFDFHVPFASQMRFVLNSLLLNDEIEADEAIFQHGALLDGGFVANYTVLEHDPKKYQFSIVAACIKLFSHISSIVTLFIM